MPTADRREFVPAAIAGFLAQTVEQAELLVLDNGREPVADLVPAHPRVRYVRETALRTLGALRNRACELTGGEVIAHWDDDDWYPPDRLARQLAVLASEQADVCGSSRIYFFCASTRRAWEYRYGDTRRPWVAGATLAYRRSFWRAHRFAEVQVGEDSRFVWSSRPLKLADLAWPGICVARIHAGNTSAKRPAPPWWHAIDPASVEALVGARPAPAVESAPPRHVCIGIHATGDLAGVERTLRSLGHGGGQRLSVVVLGDGVDAPTQAAIEAMGGIRASCTGEARGAAACFNRLVEGRDADVFVFIESAAIAGPGWLDGMLAALDADARHGLVGPTTNRSWNAQGALSAQAADAGNVDALARLARDRFGSRWQRLDRLHCLADFCYAVRREVVSAIGAADEGYGTGPCWEMDYTLRAARAGFAAVWAQGAYVYRAPVDARRQRDEALGFEASKHRYQDKFCGLRLSGARASYGEHCAGEDCRHFAPAAAIEREIAFSPRPAVSRARATPNTMPLISCIMPTRDRLEWLLQSVAYFQRQAYPARELIIVDDGLQPAKPHLPCDPRIRLVRVERRTSIGVKRNLACEAAAGEFIAHWDDDDWYAPTRLGSQVQPLLDGSADITAFDNTVFFELEGWRFWACEPALYRRLFVGAVHGGTLMFRRRLHDRSTRYPDAWLAEDAAFLSAATKRGARLQAVDGTSHYLYLRHGTNSWRLAGDQAPGSAGWRAVEEPQALAHDRAFYVSRRAALAKRSLA
jgi:glycosyltransferase involved in cell wall biosynthesis